MAGSSLCKSTVLKIYQDVIVDVINNVEDIFTEDGVDSQVLQQLRQTWEAKLLASKAVDTQTDAERQIQEKAKELAKQPQKRIVTQQNVAQVPSTIPVQAQQPQVVHVVETKMVPIQIKLPVDPSSTNPAPVLTVQIPAAALQANQLQKILNGNMIATLMGLTPAAASSFLQQQINANFLQQPTTNKIIQGDGNFDSSDDDEEVAGVSSPATKKFKPAKKQVNTQSDLSDDEGGSDNDSLSDESITEKNVEIEVEESEPLNSDDDVSEEEQAEFFDVENVVVCQYDKITRNRNKWKFHMKAGIMNLNGEDYLFEKINGEAEW